MATVYIKTAEGGESTTPTTSHYLPLDDGTNSTYISIANLLKFINSLTADTAPTTSDSIATYDASASAAKKVVLSNLYKSLGSGTQDTTTFLRGDGTYAVPSSNTIIQVVHTQTGAVATGTTTIPDDDTIPQNTEGTEFMTLAITPTSATNKLLIEVVFIYTHTVQAATTCALFQDSTANALAASQRNANAGYTGEIVFRHEMTSGTTSATTFKVRAGSSAAGTLTFNGSSGTRKMGGVMASSIRITEVKV